MRCVSYTKAVPNRKRDHLPANAIGIQNEHIQEYLKKRGWRLEAKYSDRKNSVEETAAFDRMTEDGVNRKFDFVIVDSLIFCGRDLWFAIEVLQQTFYPAGIHFAVVEDDFCSLNKTWEEVDAYFKKKRMERIGEDAWARTRDLEREGILTRRQLRYGYLLEDDHRGMKIDLSVETIVQEIFQRFLAGANMSDIANDLNRRGIVSPQEHMVRVAGKEPNFISDSKWNSATISKMLQNPVYIGKAKRIVNGKETVLEVPAIVSEDDFQQAAEIFARRKKEIHWKTRNANILVKRIRDKETGRSLMCLKNPYTDGKYVYTLKKQVRYITKKECSLCIPYDAVIDKILETLRREKIQAQKISRILGTMEAEKALSREFSTCTEQAQPLILYINDAYEKRMRLYQELEDGGLSRQEFEEGIRECSDTFAYCEDAFQAIQKQAEEIQKTFSQANPWLQTYRDIEIPDTLEREHVHKWIREILVEDFKTVEITLIQQEWKKLFPQGWLEEE